MKNLSWILGFVVIITPLYAGTPTLTFRFERSLKAQGEKAAAELLAGFYEDVAFGAPKVALEISGGLVIPTTEWAEKSYHLTIVAKLNTIEGYRKLVDFHSSNADAGIYNYNGQLKVYPYEPMGGNLSPDEYFVLTLSRNTQNQSLKVYLNGDEVIQLIDGEAVATLGASLSLFRDDVATSGQEQAPGRIALLRLEEGSVDSSVAREIFLQQRH